MFADFAVTARVEATLTVPSACVVNKINELEVTALLDTTVVAEPPKTNVPAEQVAELVAGITSLLPAVLITKFPLVAVMLPNVAVIVVAAVRDPETEGDPVKAGSAPVEPARSVPVAPTDNFVIVEVPAPTRTAWLVNPVKATVAVEPDPVVVRLPLPDRLMFPAVGVTTVASCVVRVLRSPAPAPNSVQVGVVTPADVETEVKEYSVLETSLIHRWPIASPTVKKLPGFTLATIAPLITLYPNDCAYTTALVGRVIKSPSIYPYLRLTKIFLKKINQIIFRTSKLLRYESKKNKDQNEK